MAADPGIARGTPPIEATFLFQSVSLGGVLAAGLMSDLLLARLRPGPARPLALRLLAAVLPMLVYASYFAVLGNRQGVWWSIHLWAGGVPGAGGRLAGG